jgi:uncharacterized membrane protein
MKRKLIAFLLCPTFFQSTHQRINASRYVDAFHAIADSLAIAIPLPSLPHFSAFLAINRDI